MVQRIGNPRLARGNKLHHKFAIIDKKVVINGSFNWSTSAAHTKDEPLLVIHSAKLAADFTHEMEHHRHGAELGMTPLSNANSTTNGSSAEMGWRRPERHNRPRE